MDKLIINSTPNTPEIILDPEKRIFSVSGHSFPENAVDVYAPVFVWVETNFQALTGEINFEFKLEYFNTASAKLILDLFMKLEKFYKKGSKVRIKWYFDEEDIDMETAGQDYSEIVELPFDLIAVTENE